MPTHLRQTAADSSIWSKGALEDKIVQRAVAEVLNTIYECDFLGFSYGFRPGRRPHDALDALAVAITRGRVNWILDADIRDFFTGLDQRHLERFLEHRIAGVPQLVGIFARPGSRFACKSRGEVVAERESL